MKKPPRRKGGQALYQTDHPIRQIARIPQYRPISGRLKGSMPMKRAQKSRRLQLDKETLRNITAGVVLPQGTITQASSCTAPSCTVFSEDCTTTLLTQ